ncbi:MAG TPA: DUF6282 family protein [Xanthobacteraceae bacterium]|nr:DUF6282 family protein [Xanthobacteraceae bacterium]
MTETVQADESVRIKDLLKGAVDLHVHSGPSLMPRKIDHVEAAQQAAAAGFRAILLKDHYYPTMPLAHILNKHYPSDTEVLSAIVLNNPLGGINPSAVDYALKQGARVVWMPTAHANNHLDHYKTDAKFDSKFPTATQKVLEPIALSLLGPDGQVADEVKAILDLVAAADAVISGGHHHARELLPFYEEAKARGVKRLLLNHPTYVNECTLQDVSHLVSLGVKMEHSICMFVPSTFYLFDVDHLKSVIAAAGVENTLFGSDLGQNNNPTPVEGFEQIVALLIAAGYSDADIRLMTSRNAADLAGLATAAH